MRTSYWIRLLLIWSVQTSGRFVVALHSNTSERMSSVSVELRKDEGNTLQVKPKITVDILMGKGVELQCRNKTREGSVKWWQTPFGSFEDGQFSNRDPVEIDNGNLRILKTTASHSGLYYCHLVDGSGITIIPYTVNVVRANRIQHEETYMRQRLARGTEASFSQSQFAAAVTSSILVTFIGAFALGAFSRSYVIKCLSKTGHKIRDKTASHEPRNGDEIFAVALNEQSLQFECVSFHRNRNLEDDTIVFAPKSSPRVRTPNSFQSNQENRGNLYLEGCSSSASAIEGETSDTLNRPAGDEADQLEGQGGEEQASEAASDLGTHPQPKRRSRVIKLYNYDEEGNRYSHITEPEELDENEPRCRHRVMSLTRLSAIMSQAESLNFSTTGDSGNSGPTNPDEPLSKE